MLVSGSEYGQSDIQNRLSEYGLKRVPIKKIETHQGVIQDFEVEGGNEKSNQKMLLKKGQLLFQYPAMDTQS